MSFRRHILRLTRNTYQKEECPQDEGAQHGDNLQDVKYVRYQEVHIEMFVIKLIRNQSEVNGRSTSAW